MLIAILVFCAVFAILALVLIAAGNPTASRKAQATLAAVLQTASVTRQNEEIADIRKAHVLSSIPWVNALLSRMNAALELRRMLNQADLDWTPGRLLLTCVATAAIAGYLATARTHSTELGVVLGLLAGTVPLFYVSHKRRRRLAKFQEKLPEALDLMVSALRAGQTMIGSLGAAAREAGDPVGRELRLCFEEQNFGIDMRTAMENLVDRVPLQAVRMLATAVMIHKESGGNLAEVLDKTAQTIRERFQLLQQIQVHTAQGRLTGWVLSLLPFALGLLMYTIRPDYIRLLFDRPVGHKIMAIAVVMNVIGLLIIRRIVKIRA